VVLPVTFHVSMSMRIVFFCRGGTSSDSGGSFRSPSLLLDRLRWSVLLPWLPMLKLAPAGAPSPTVPASRSVASTTRRGPAGVFDFAALAENGNIRSSEGTIRNSRVIRALYYNMFSEDYRF